MLTSVQVVTPPAAEPISLPTIKQHIRIDNDADDTLVGTYLTVARTMAEQYLSRALITQKLLWTLRPEGLLHPLRQNRLPGRLALPRAPVQAVQSVITTDTLGNVTTIAPSVLPIVPPAPLIGWWADTALEPASLMLGPDTVTASGTCLRNVNLENVQVTFTAGYDGTGALCPAPILHAIMLTTAFLYENRGDAEAEMPTAAHWLLDPFRLQFLGG